MSSLILTLTWNRILSKKHESFMDSSFTFRHSVQLIQNAEHKDLGQHTLQIFENCHFRSGTLTPTVKQQLICKTTKKKRFTQC